METMHPPDDNRAAEVALKTIQRFHEIAHHSAERSPLKVPTVSTGVDGEGASFEGSVLTDGVGGRNGRSLFLFSENNMLRKAAKALIDWGYPFYGSDVSISSIFLLKFVLVGVFYDTEIKMEPALLPSGIFCSLVAETNLQISQKPRQYY
uniref:FRIGIDA-like protein n=1 Tax=Mesocestoides corti TaxID=53468 RepID=A0A5K3ETW1_MESCO